MDTFLIIKYVMRIVEVLPRFVEFLCERDGFGFQILYTIHMYSIKC